MTHRAHAASGSSRLASIDLLRGVVMALMALDHIRDFVTHLRFPPENLARGSAALFATRWFTHFCAPAFALLAGIGIGLAMRRRTPREMTRFLITRGLWLIVLDTVITPVGWRFSFDIVPIYALVLWALGWSMIVMAALVHLPRAAIATLSLIVIAGHNLLDGVRPEAWGSWAWLWQTLHVQGFAVPGTLLIAYPLVPWVAVMALGWVLAGVYEWEPARRRAFLLWTGAAATVLFVIVRAANGYGNPFPWAPQRTPALTVASFLNVTKYPPSLAFLLMTLGPALMALALFERAKGRLVSWLAVFGRVPLFFYAVHIVVVHLAGMALAFAQGGVLMRIPAVSDPASMPPWYGVSLPGVYAAWILVLLIMYPICRWFAHLKETRRDWWLAYL